MSTSKVNPLNDSELGYSQLFAVLLRRRFLLLGILLCALAGSTYLSTKKESTYRSAMQLLVEPNYEQRPDALREGLPESLLPGAATVEIDYATEIRLMQSPTLVDRAVEELRKEYPEISTREIRGGLAVTRVLETEDEVETKILQVEYTSNNPEKTQRVLDVLKEVYLSYSQEQQKNRLNNGLAFIDEQLPEVRGEVAQAERSLEQFREGQGVINPETQAEEVTRALNAIAEERRTIRAQYEDTQVRFNNTQQQLARSPESALLASRLSQSERFQTLLNTLQQTEFALAQQRVTYTDNAPTVRALVRELNSQRALLQREAAQILGDAAGQFNLSESSLLSESQLSDVDLDLTNQLVETQTNLVGLSARDQSLAQAESRLRSELNRFPELIAEYNRLQPDIDIKRDTLQELLRARQELGIEIARGGYNWQVVESADLGEKTGPNLGTDLLLGAVLGLFLGSLVVFLVESVDSVIHSTDKLKETVALPLIGTVPRLPQSITGSRFSFNRAKGLPTLQAANWPLFRESMDLIYKNIQRSSAGAGLKSIAITSALAGEGKTTVALGLALSAARLHQRVLLIDANLRSPSLHRQLNLVNDQGLSTLSELDYKSLNLHSLNSNIDILTAGPTPPDPVRVLSSKRIKEWIKSFERDYDLVILDASSVLGIVDAIQTASLCNGVLMVTRLDRINQSDLIQAVTTLGESNVLGIVANDAKNLKSHYSNQTLIEEEFFVPQQHGLLNNKGVADQLDKIKLP